MFSLQILLGRVCTIAELHKKELPIVVRVSDNAQFDCPSSSSKSTDHVAKRYLQDLLQEISQAGGGELIPVGVEVSLLEIFLDACSARPKYLCLSQTSFSDRT